jgi:hypothetical protein
LLAGAAIALSLGARSAMASKTDLLNALADLEGHIDGSAPLNASQIEANRLVLDDNSHRFGNSNATINASFGLVQTYESQYGPMWSAGSPTQNGFTRSTASNGDIHWTMFHAMQYIVDDTYTSNNIANRQDLLDGYKFGSADVVPGPVTPPSNPNTTYTVAIDGSFLNTYGRNTMHWAEADRNARKATGTYLAPGSIATVSVPQALVDAGYKIRVGGQSWDFSNKNPVDRLDRVSLVYDIDSTSVQIASPLGGNIYIEVPFEADSGVVDIDIQNVVRSPFFSMQNHHTTTLSEWQTTERNFAAPWTDFQSEKYAMVVPTGWVYAMDDPKTLMENWDKAMDVTNDLMGFPRDRGKETLANGVDVRIRGGAYAPGYPSVNNTYDPLRNNDASDWNSAPNAYTGTSSSYLVQGPQLAPDYEFHEMGHAYLFPKLPGETESAINLLHVAVMNQAFGMDIQQAFYTSMRGHNSYHTLDHTAVTWMTSFNFFIHREPMHQLETQYQLKGHAKFVEVARVLGWGVLNDYYGSFNEDYEATGSTPNPGTDGHLLRLSRAAGVDITPLFHFWGDHPENYTTLRAELDAEGIGASRDIYDLLRHYRTLVPEDNQTFRSHAVAWWGGEPSLDGYWTESEHARQWDELDPSGQPNEEMYTENSAALIRDVIQDLLTTYYLEFMIDLNGDELLDGDDWGILITNAQTDMSGMTYEQALALGDLDGDMDNDIDDFLLFRQGYELVHTEGGAFGAMVAAYSVPEPGTGLLVIAGFALGCLRRRRGRHPY